MGYGRRFRILAWLALAVALVLLFNFVPRLQGLPTIAVLIPAVAFVALRFLRANRKGTLCWNRRVYGILRANHLIVSGIVGMGVAFAWMAIMLDRINENPAELLDFVIVPFCMLVVAASVAFAVGLYYARGE
jgi:hypothetical protein